MKLKILFPGISLLCVLSAPGILAEGPSQVHVVQGASKIIRNAPDRSSTVITEADGTLEVLDFHGPYQSDEVRRFNWIKVRIGCRTGWIPGDRVIPEHSSLTRVYTQQANGWAWQALHLMKDGNFLFYQTLICQEDGPIQFTQTNTLTGRWKMERSTIFLSWGPDNGQSWSFPDPSELNRDLKKTPGMNWTWEFPADAETIKIGGVAMESKMR